MRSCCASRTGSPPRMRGKVCTYSATEHGYGITPAYAGKSRPDPEPDAGTGDHPRVCGEKLIPPLLGFGFTGSPPRMRGKVEIHCRCVFDVGITPAYAGKSDGLSSLNQFLKDHPRVCGEKDPNEGEHGKPKGSPPRMRGKVQIALDFCVSVEDHPRVCGEKKYRKGV